MGVEALADVEVNDAPVVETAVEAVVEPEVDLSAVPEKARAYVDTKKYVEDTDYKRAIEHGWKPLEKFVEDGGDDATWTGYKKFNKSYDDELFRRELRDELKASKKSQQAIIETFEQQKRDAIAAALAEREAQFKVAVEDGNTAEAVRLQREILQNQAAIQPQAMPEPLPIIAIRRANEALNPASADFNQEANAEFERICIQQAQSYKQTYGRALSDLEIKLIGEEALNMVKDKLVKPQPKPVQKPVAVAKPAATESKTSTRMSGIQKQMYDKLLNSHGKAVADNYIKNSQNA
jgi:hypothetical protein